MFFGQVAKAAGAKHSFPHTASSVTAVSANRTTSSSNAVIIPKQESNHHCDAGPSHGFLEEDEYEECKAALTSPIKGGKRLSSAVSTHLFYFDHFWPIICQAIVKLEHTTPPPSGSKHVAVGRKEKFTNAHLPHGCQDNGAWRRIFVPTYLQYLASRNSDNDAWAINDEEAVSVQQKVWDFVYGDKVPHIVTVQGPVFALVGSMLLPSSTILIMTLSRSINASVNGAADSLLLPYLLLMLSSTTTSTIPMTAVKNSQSLLWCLGLFSTVMFPLPRTVR